MEMSIGLYKDASTAEFAESAESFSGILCGLRGKKNFLQWSLIE